jgi:hypothetical protein
VLLAAAENVFVPWVPLQAAAAAVTKLPHVSAGLQVAGGTEVRMQNTKRYWLSMTFGLPLWTKHSSGLSDVIAMQRLKGGCKMGLVLPVDVWRRLSRKADLTLLAILLYLAPQ